MTGFVIPFFSKLAANFPRKGSHVELVLLPRAPKSNSSLRPFLNTPNQLVRNSSSDGPSDLTRLFQY